MNSEITTDPWSRPRWAWTAGALIVAIVFCVYLAVLSNGIVMDATDWAMYVMHARNILHGRAYADTPYVFQPEANFQGPRSYPSGFSLLLVPLYAMFGMSIKAFKIAVDAELALSLAPIYVFCRRYVSTWSALCIIVATAFGWEYMRVQNELGSDAQYQLLSFAAIVLLLWVYDRGKDNAQGWFWGALCGAIAAGAYLSRPIGLALVVAAAIADVLRRRRISIFLIAFLLSIAAFVLINNSLFHKDSSYNDEFTLSLRLIASHAVDYFIGLSEVFTNPVSKGFRHLAWAPFVLLAATGVWTKIRRTGLTFVELYCAVLLAVLCVYWLSNTRYLLPVLPIFLCYAALGLGALIERLPAQFRLVVWLTAAAALLVAPAFNLVRIQSFHYDSLVETPDFRELCEQLRAKTGTHDYVMFWNPRVLALYTDRPASAYPKVPQEDLQHYVDRIQPNYIVIDRQWDEDRQYLSPMMDALPGKYVSVFENERFKIEQVVNLAPRDSAFGSHP